MTIDRKKFEWNLNTLLSLITLGMMVIGGVAFQVNQTRDIDEVKRWQSDHDKTTEARVIESRTNRGQTEERIKANEKDIAANDRKQDQIQYRLTVVEQQTANQNQTMEGLKTDFNDVKGDIKVMREILQRLDTAKGPSK